jgi:hypothetical protein
LDDEEDDNEDDVEDDDNWSTQFRTIVEYKHAGNMTA